MDVERVEIFNEDNSITVRVGDRTATKLGSDEALWLVANLLINSNNHHRWLMTEEEHRKQDLWLQGVSQSTEETI